MASNVTPTIVPPEPSSKNENNETASNKSSTAIGSAAASCTENQYFYEDEVYKFDENGRVRFGLVMETYETGASDVEQSDVEDQLKKREIRVAWHPRGTEEITQEQFVSC